MAIEETGYCRVPCQCPLPPTLLLHPHKCFCLCRLVGCWSTFDQAGTWPRLLLHHLLLLPPGAEYCFPLGRYCPHGGCALRILRRLLLSAQSEPLHLQCLQSGSACYSHF